MTDVTLLNSKFEKSGSVKTNLDLSPETINMAVVHQVVKATLAGRRQGTAMTKTKALVSGGGKKPFKQKGTGNARQGSTRSPLMPGGGTMFGPQPRSYAYVLPKKVRRLGLSMALSHLHSEGKLFVVENMKSEGKTNELQKRLKSFGLEKAVLIDASADEKFSRATRNLPSFKYFPVEGLNVFDLLKYDAAVITKDSVAKIIDRCSLENA